MTRQLAHLFIVCLDAAIVTVGVAGIAYGAAIVIHRVWERIV